MNITKKEQSENKEFTQKIGLGEFKVLALNPTREELLKLYDVSEDKQDSWKEQNYISEDDQNNTKVLLNFICEDVNSKEKFNLRFNLVDKIQENKDGSKCQWISSVGASSWVDDEANLPNWFKEFQNKDKQKIGDKAIRKAHQGEADLMNFLRTWMQGVDFFNPEVNILLDWNKLCRGNFKELTSLISSDEVGTIVGMVEVRTVDGENGAVKRYSSLYNKSLLPGYKMKLLRNSIVGGSPLTDKACTKFKDELYGEYGPKNSIFWGMLEDFDATKHLAIAPDKVHSPEDSSY